MADKAHKLSDERREAANARRRAANNPEWAAKNNARRRAKYAADAEHREHLLAKMRNDRAANPERHREWDRQNAAKNKGPGSDYNKRRYAALDKDKVRAEHKAWRDKNPDKLYLYTRAYFLKDPAGASQRTKRWQDKNPGAVSAIRARRRARLANASGEYTAKDVSYLFKKYGRVCFYCDVKLEKFHVDHFIPLSRGGSNYPHNLRLSCPTCNLSKGGKMPWEWKPDRFRCDEVG